MCESWDVFVSHSNYDKNKILFIINDLRKAGLKLWYDESSLAVGDRVREAINEGIRNSSTVLIFISSNSLGSRWVLNELDAAMLREVSERKTIVIPILIGKLGIDQLPEDIKGKKFLDFRYDIEKKYFKFRQTLITTLGSLITPRGSADVSDSNELRNDIPLGPKLIYYILTYKFTGRNELDERRGIVTDKVLDAFSDSLWDTLKEDEDNERRESTINFLSKHGIVFARSLFRYVLDFSNVSLTKLFTDDDLIGLLKTMYVWVVAFALQETLEGSGLEIRMGFMEDGKYGFRLVGSEPS